MQRTIIFLHGKQSTPEGSGSGKAIREHFSKEHTVLIPDYKPMERTHQEIEAYLKAYISPRPGALIVGISLGGYWAYRMTCTLPASLGVQVIMGHLLKNRFVTFFNGNGVSPGFLALKAKLKTIFRVYFSISDQLKILLKLLASEKTLARYFSGPKHSTAFCPFLRH